MNRFSKGLLTGGVIGATAIMMVLSDQKSRKKMAKSGKRMMNDAQDVVGDLRNKMF